MPNKDISVSHMRFMMNNMFNILSNQSDSTKEQRENSRKFLIDADINEIKCLFLQDYDKIYNKLFRTQNRGDGAGGKQTNINGKQWETVTSNEFNLSHFGFKPCNGYLVMEKNDTTITYFSQGQLKRFFLNKYGLIIYRNPDEAYLIQKNGKMVLKILEKKFQNVDGSVEDKLLSGNQIKREYMISLESLNIDVSYAYCISGFLEKKIKSNKLKFVIWNRLFLQDDITIFFGESDDYFVKLNEWVFLDSGINVD
jgi:hypothetical protein